MIKSSDSHDKTYRVIKVLASQDYLAVDPAHNHYILAPHPAFIKNNQSPKYLPKEKLQQTSRIIHKIEQVSIDQIDYHIFEAGKRSAVWVKDILPKYLLSASFISNFVTDAIFNLLSQLVWFSTDIVLPFLDVRNLWLFDNKIHILSMQRTANTTITKRQSFKKSQNFRSHSLQSSKITVIIDKEMVIVRKFGQILIDVLGLNRYSQTEAEIDPCISKVLREMISKQISYDQLVVQLEGVTLKNSKHMRTISLSPFRQGRMSLRARTEPTIFPQATKKKKKSLLSFDGRTQFRKISKTLHFQKRDKSELMTLEPSSQAKSTLVINQQNLAEQLRKAKQTNSSLAKPMPILCRPKHSLLAGVKKTQVYNPIGPEAGQAKYLNWLFVSKHSLQTCPDKPVYQKLKLKESDPSVCVQKENKVHELQQKLLKKVQHYRATKYCKSVQTQTIDFSNQGKEKQQADNDNKIGRSSSIDEREGFIFTTANNQKENSTADKQIEGVRNQGSIGKQLSNFQKNDKSEVVRRISFGSEDELFKEKIQQQRKQSLPNHNSENRRILWNQAKNTFDDEIQEVKFYSLYKNQDQIEGTTKQDPYQRASVDNETIMAETIRHQRSIVAQTPSQSEKLKQIDSSKFQVLDLSKNDKKTRKDSRKLSQQKYPDKHIDSKSFPKDMPIASSLQKQRGQRYKSIKQLHEQIHEYISLVNILADTSVYCVKNKQKLKKYQWRASIYFLYQRFQYQRRQLLNNLKNNRLDHLVRRHESVHNDLIVPWANSREKVNTISQVERENENIAATLAKLSKKTLQQCKLQPNIEKFIRNRSKILSSNNKNVRLFLSKYAVAFIINEFDEALERKNNSNEQNNYIIKCIFGLKVLCELDGRDCGRSVLKLEDYEKGVRRLKELAVEVEGLYDCYYKSGRGIQIE